LTDLLLYAEQNVLKQTTYLLII